MPSSKDYLEFVLEHCSGLTFRSMMGEYVLYYGSKVIGGIYDNRFLVKPTKSALKLIPDVRLELPYEGAKEMLLVENIEDEEFLKELLEALYRDLPESQNKK